MENREVVDIIAEAKNKKWFDEKKIEINYPVINQRLSFDSFISFHNYIKRQIQLIAKVNEQQNLPLELRTIVEIFNGIYNNLLFFVANFSKESEGDLENKWDNIVKIKFQDQPNLIPLDSDLFTTLLDLNSKGLNTFLGAYKYVFENTIIQNNRGFIAKETLNGILEIHRVTKGERFYSNLLEIKAKELENLKQQFEGKIADSEVKLTDYLVNINNKYNGYTNEIDEYKTSKEIEVNAWFLKTQNGFNTFNESSQKKIAELEKTYQEKLRLSKPAEYWNRRAEVLKKEGWTALKWLVFVIFIACISLYVLLWSTPKDMLENLFSGKISAIRWSIVYITFISFLAVGMRAITKVMFSSFHLSRDAEEREQLSYFYLALIQESAVDDKDRHLIMQSLFSRADSGLLKEDSSPTMPSGIDKIISR